MAAAGGHHEGSRAGAVDLVLEIDQANLTLGAGLDQDRTAPSPKRMQVERSV